MGVFTRFKDIISSNINSILDNAEDPEKMLKMMIQEMEDTLIELKSSCAFKMAAREDVEDDVDIAESKILRWEARAKKALSIGEEDLAKEALLEKRKIQKELKILNENISEYKKIVSESKKDIIMLEEKLEETIKKHDILVQRSLHAREKEKARRIIKNSESFKTGERFRRFESAIKDIEREADFEDPESSNLNKKFEKMETDEEIQSELDELKKDLKK